MVATPQHLAWNQRATVEASMGRLGRSSDSHGVGEDGVVGRRERVEAEKPEHLIEAAGAGNLRHVLGGFQRQHALRETFGCDFAISLLDLNTDSLPPESLGSNQGGATTHERV